MESNKQKHQTKIVLWVLSSLMMIPLLGGCSALDRLSHVGAEPEMSRIENPAEDKKISCRVHAHARSQKSKARK